MKNKLYIFILVLLIISCNTSNKNIDSVKTIAFNTFQSHPGKKFMEANCYSCHNATTSEQNRIAPPMIAIKRRYQMGNTTKREFIDDMQTFINNPNENNAKMFGAVKRFGVMQKLSYPEDIIEQIADYIYDHAIEEPIWFKEHYNQNMMKQKY